VTTYHDYFSSSYDLATRVSRLASYIGELEAMSAGLDVSSSGDSVSRSALNTKIRDLQDLHFRMQAQLDASTGHRASRVRFLRN